jgi:hypothetical protein
MFIATTGAVAVLAANAQIWGVGRGHTEGIATALRKPNKIARERDGAFIHGRRKWGRQGWEADGQMGRWADGQLEGNAGVGYFGAVSVMEAHT